MARRALGGPWEGDTDGKEDLEAGHDVRTSALIAGCTHYSAIPLNMVGLRDKGREGFTISTEEAEGTDFGRVRGNGRTWLFGDCRPAAETAMREMIERARERGGTRIVDLKFRGKWAWKTAPLCRRNLTYVVFVLPLFVPWPEILSNVVDRVV